MSVVRLVGLLFFALACCVVIVLVGGGWAFVRRPVGVSYLTLWSLWWLLIAIGRQRGVPSTYDRSQRLILALEPSLRMALLDALHEAAGEITAQLDGAVVTVGLANREPVFTVVGARTAAPGRARAARTASRRFGIDSARFLGRRFGIDSALRARCRGSSPRATAGGGIWGLMLVAQLAVAR